MFVIRAARTALLLTVTGAGCYYQSAPDGWLPTPAAAAASAYGGWAIVKLKSGTVYQGELMAAGADTIHLLQDRTWMALSQDSIAEARVERFVLSDDGVAGWALVGALSAVSHGYFIVFTGPIWLVSGVAAAASVSGAQQVSSKDPYGFREYARFPQGVPADLDRSAVAPKPPRPE